MGGGVLCDVLADSYLWVDWLADLDFSFSFSSSLSSIEGRPGGDGDCDGGGGVLRDERPGV